MSVPSAIMIMPEIKKYEYGVRYQNPSNMNTFKVSMCEDLDDAIGIKEFVEGRGALNVTVVRRDISEWYKIEDGK